MKKGSKEENRADDSGSSGDLLQHFDNLAAGWKLEDLKTIKKAADKQRTSKSMAAVKSLARMSVLAKKTDASQKNFQQMLFSLNPAVKMIREKSDFILCEISANLRLPVLPRGYSFKGGAARIALLHILGVNTRKVTARDIDLLRIGEGSSEQDRDLAMKFMPEDFRFGHGVEVTESLSQYFASRDITINEVILSGKRVVFSKTAFEDLKNGRVRLSSLYSSGKRELTGLLLCKMLRLKAELEVLGLDGELILPKQQNKASTRDYERHLARAAEAGAKVLQRYKELCGQYLKISAANNKNQKSSHSASDRLNLRSELGRFRKRR